jgi:hypothetical protein
VEFLRRIWHKMTAWFRDVPEDGMDEAEDYDPWGEAK